MLKIALTALVTALAALACGGDGVDSRPGAPPTAATSPGQSATATPFPRVDGTVDPLGFGGTDPVTIKANPDPPSGIAVLRDVRIGSHPEEGGWDRIVFEFESGLPPGQVSYAASVSQCGSGAPVQVAGQAVLSVRFTSAQAHNEAGQLTIKSQQLSGPGGAILEARQYCDFEGHVDWAVGLRSKQRFKFTVLSNPTRLVIDIKW